MRWVGPVGKDDVDGELAEAIAAPGGDADDGWPGCWNDDRLEGER